MADHALSMLMYVNFESRQHIIIKTILILYNLILFLANSNLKHHTDIQMCPQAPYIWLLLKL